MVSSSKYIFGVLWSVGFVAFALVPVLMTSRYQMNLASHILIWGLFAVSFNMLWGVTGMLLSVRRYISGSGHTASACLSPTPGNPGI